MARGKRSPFILLTAKDWAEIFYAVELKCLCVAKYNRENGRYAESKRELQAALPFIEVTPDVQRYRVKIEGAIE